MNNGNDNRNIQGSQIIINQEYFDKLKHEENMKEIKRQADLKVKQLDEERLKNDKEHARRMEKSQKDFQQRIEEIEDENKKGKEEIEKDFQQRMNEENIRHAEEMRKIQGSFQQKFDNNNNNEDYAKEMKRLKEEHQRRIKKIKDEGKAELDEHEAKMESMKNNYKEEMKKKAVIMKQANYDHMMKMGEHLVNFIKLFKEKVFLDLEAGDILAVKEDYCILLHEIVQRFNLFVENFEYEEIKKEGLSQLKGLYGLLLYYHDEVEMMNEKYDMSALTAWYFESLSEVMEILRSIGAFYTPSVE